MKKKQFLIPLVFLLIISIPVLLPLFHAGFFVTDDGEWMIIRFSAFYQALADGQFPVRFLHRLNFDYGYPVATFLYPGFMYAAVPFHVFKIGFVDSVKTILGLSLVGTTVFTYFWLTQVFKNKIAAITGAVVSLYLPYHLYDVYTRGSIGEIFALLWVTFILWMIERKNFFFITVGIFLLLLSHNSLALLFLPVLFLYGFVREVLPVRQLFFSFLFGVLLSSFFIIPAVFELSFTNFSNIVVSDPIEYFADIRLIGFETLLIFFFSLVIIFSKKKLITGNKLLVILFLSLTFLTIVFSSSLSSLFWQFFPSAFIQFPFRLLSYFVIATAFLSAFVITEVQDVIKRMILLVCLASILIISSVPFMTPKIYFDKGEGYYFTNEATTTVQDEYMPVWVKEKPTERPERKVEIISGEGTIENIIYNNKQTSFSITAADPVRVKIYTVYWPGWQVFIDNKEAIVSYSNPAGLIEVDIPKGTHQVRAEFGETPLRLFADGISVVSFVGLLLFIFSKKRK